MDTSAFKLTVAAEEELLPVHGDSAITMVSSSAVASTLPNEEVEPLVARQKSPPRQASISLQMSKIPQTSVSVGMESCVSAEEPLSEGESEIEGEEERYAIEVPMGQSLVATGSSQLAADSGIFELLPSEAGTSLQCNYNSEPHHQNESNIEDSGYKALQKNQQTPFPTEIEDLERSSIDTGQDQSRLKAVEENSSNFDSGLISDAEDRRLVTAT